MLSARDFRVRYISFVTLACFAMTTTTWALPSTANLPESMAPAIKSVEIPEELASIEQTFQSHSPDRPLVIHIQNAHSNIESQFQIRSILRYMFQKTGMRLALVEGAVNQLDPSLLQFFPDRDLNVKINEQLATQGMVSGVQLFLLESGDDMKVFGIEDAKLYRENLANFRDVMRDESTIQKFLSFGTAVLTNLEQKLFDRELGEFVTKRKAFNEHRLDLVAHADDLRILARKYLNLDLGRADAQYEWPALVRLIMLKNIEEIDKDTFEAEYKQLETHLAQSGVPASLREKLNDLKSHASGKSEIRFDSAKPRFLVEQIYLKDSGSFPVAQYPHVANWLVREILGSELDGGELMTEIEKLSGLILERLTASPIEKELLKLIEDFDLLASALNLELTGEQFDTLNERKSEIEFDALAKRFTTLQEEAGVPASAIKPFQVSSEKMNALLEAANRFYEHARLRDDAMVRKTAEIVKREHAGVVALITGGFHTQGILRELREDDISYVAITPRLKGALNLDRTNYISNLMNTKPNIFAQAHLDAIQIAQANIRDVFPQMDPDYKGGDIPKTLEELATAIIASAVALKIPAALLPSFQSNALLDLKIELSADKRWVIVKGWGREVKYPMGMDGRLDENSLRGAVATRLVKETPGEPGQKIEAPPTAAVVEKAEKIVAGHLEQEFLSVLKQLSQPESLARINETSLRALNQALVDVNAASTPSERSTAVNKVPSILAEMSSGASGTLALRGLASRMPPGRIWAALAESNFPEALSRFLGLPVINIEKPETAQAIPAPEMLESEPAAAGFGAAVNVSRVLPQTPASRVQTIRQILTGIGAMPVPGQLDENAMANALLEREAEIKGSRIGKLVEAMGVEISSVPNGISDSLAGTLADILTGDVRTENLPAATALIEETSRLLVSGRSLERRFPFEGTGILDVLFFESLSGRPVAGAEVFKLGVAGETVRVRKIIPSRTETETLKPGGSMQITPEFSIFRSLDKAHPELVVEGPAIALVQVRSGFGFEKVPESSATAPNVPKIAAPISIEKAPALPDVTQFTVDQLLAEIAKEFGPLAGDQTITPQTILQIKLRVAREIAKGVVEPNRFVREISRRGGIDFSIDSEGVPVPATGESAVATALTYTQGMGAHYHEALGRSGGIAVVYDATRGVAPSEAEVKAYLAQLKETAAANLKVAIIVRVSDVTQKSHEVLIRRVAQGLGLDSKQYKIMTAVNDTEFAKKIANVPNMLASYVTDGERREHVTFIVPETLREEVTDYLPEGVHAIFHGIQSTQSGADVLHYWLGTGAVLYALLSQELDDARVRAILEPFKTDSGRPGFVNFIARLALDLKTDFQIMQRVLTSV